MAADTYQNRARSAFLARLQEITRCTQAEAEKVFQVYQNSRLVALDTSAWRYEVAHGAFLEPDVIRRAIEHQGAFCV